MAQTSFGRRSSVAAAVLLSAFVWSQPLAQQKAGPVFLEGQAQIVPAFPDSAQWIKQTSGSRPSSIPTGTEEGPHARGRHAASPNGHRRV